MITVRIDGMLATLNTLTWSSEHPVLERALTQMTHPNLVPAEYGDPERAIALRMIAIFGGEIVDDGHIDSSRLAP